MCLHTRTAELSSYSLLHRITAHYIQQMGCWISVTAPISIALGVAAFAPCQADIAGAIAEHPHDHADMHLFCCMFWHMESHARQCIRLRAYLKGYISNADLSKKPILSRHLCHPRAQPRALHSNQQHHIPSFPEEMPETKARQDMSTKV